VELAHPPGVAHSDVVAAEEPGLALVAVDAGLVAPGLVGGGDDAALTAGDDLGRVEREGAEVADGAGRPSGEAGAVSVGGVLEQEQAPGPAEVGQGGGVGAY